MKHLPSYRALLFTLLSICSFFILFTFPKVVHAQTTYWEDNFQRADGAVGNGWTSIDSATGQITSNVLQRTDSGSYKVLYNPAGGTLPADYYVTVTVPNATIGRSWWGLIGRYLSTGGSGNGTGNKVFWTDQGALQMGAGHADFTNDITPTVTGGYPASWSQNQNHTVTLHYSGNTIYIYLDGSQYGYFTDSTNNQTGTGIGLVGDGGGSPAYDVLDMKVTDYLPGSGEVSISSVSSTNIATNSATIT